MSSQLIPILHWLSQSSQSIAADDLQEVVHKFRDSAKFALGNYARERGNYPTHALVSAALWELQREILDQYTPEVTADGKKSVGRMWPWWEEMKLRSGDTIHDWKPLPDRDGMVDFAGFRFRFFRNETASDRARLLHHFIKKGAWSERRFLKKDKQSEEDFDIPDQRVQNARAIEMKDFVEQLHAVADSIDLRLAAEPIPGESSKARKARSRAKRRLQLACVLLIREGFDRIASRYLHRLRDTLDGKRRPILEEYLLLFNPDLPDGLPL